MNYVNRALTSVKRRKGKSLILLALIFILGNVIAGAIAINQATRHVEDRIKTSMGAVATVDVDYQNMGEADFTAIETLAVKKIKEIGENEYVKAYDYTTQIMVRSDTLKLFSSQEKEEAPGPLMLGSEEYFSLTGVEFAPILDVFEGKVELKSGTNSRVFTEEEIASGANVGVITQKFAEKNNLHVGDTMVFQNKLMKMIEEQLTDESGAGFTAYSTDESQPPLAQRDVTIEVIGIVEPVEETKSAGKNIQEESYNRWLEEGKQNKIYVPNKVVAEEQKFYAEKSAEHNDGSDAPSMVGPLEYYTPIYILENPDDIDKFKASIAETLPKFYTVKTTRDGFDTIAAPILTIRTLSTYTLYIAIGASLLIISLLLFLFLRDRRHELGIYMSLGERRIKVMMQIILEVIMVAFVAITLSVFTGNIIAASVSDAMISNQLQSETENGVGETHQLNALGYGDNLTSGDIQSAYEVKLDASYIILFYVVGLGTVAISTVIPMIYVLRLNPKKIMM